MSNPAAFSADYVDLRFVKSRKVAQIVVEIPLESATAFVAAFGAPDPANGVPVALARLVKDAPQPSSQRNDRKSWKEMAPASQAAMRCNEPMFRKFLTHLRSGSSASVMLDTDTAAQAVRDICQVSSRGDLNINPAAAARWKRLDDDYWLWQRGAS